MTEATSEKRKSIRKAVSFLNRLVDEFSTDPEIAGLLPLQTFDMPKGSDRARSIAWDSLPEDLRISCERIMGSAVAGPKEMVELARTRIAKGEDPEAVMAELNETASTSRKSPENPDAAKSGYRTAITWLLRAAEDAVTKSPAKAGEQSYTTSWDTIIQWICEIIVLVLSPLNAGPW